MSSLVKATQHGAQYKWGFRAEDAPVIGGFVARGAELKYRPEVNSVATDGEGHVDSRTVSKAQQRAIDGVFTGYVTEDFDPTTMPDSFSFESRFYIIDEIGVPRKKGDYWEVSLTASSNAGVES